MRINFEDLFLNISFEKELIFTTVQGISIRIKGEERAFGL